MQSGYAPESRTYPCADDRHAFPIPRFFGTELPTSRDVADAPIEPALRRGLDAAAFPAQVLGVSRSLPVPSAAQAAALARQSLSPAAVDPKRKKVALVVAGIADLIQIGGFPIFSQGALSLPDDILDVVVALLLLITLGFRWRLVFSLALELTPVATLFPTWTAVVASLPTTPPPPRP